MRPCCVATHVSGSVGSGTNRLGGARLNSGHSESVNPSSGISGHGGLHSIIGHHRINSLNGNWWPILAYYSPVSGATHWEEWQ